MLNDAATESKVYNKAVGDATLRGIWMTESRFDMDPKVFEDAERSHNHT